MIKIYILNNKYDWADAIETNSEALNTQWLNPTFIYLKDYYEYYSEYKDQVEWVVPVWQDSTIDEYANWVIDNELDIVGFGFYIWNAHIWIKVAKKIKQLNPNIIILAGGPDIDFFEKEYALKLKDSFDYIIKYDGEEPLRQILDNLIEDKPIKDIDQVYTIENEKLVGKFTNTVNRRNSWYQENSPILNNKKILIDAFSEAQKRNQDILMTWGTTRGCPYKCAFCDWGVNEYRKVGKRNPKLSKRELTFLALNKVKGIVLEDANWGMFKSDIDITKHWAALYTRYKMLYRENLSHSKNQKDNVIKIIRIMAKAGMIPRYGAGLQDLDLDVLKYNDRPDLTWEEHQEVIGEIQKYTKDDTKCYAMIIPGMPGQTLNSIIETFCKLGESNLFDDYNIMPFLMLPGAPMNTPAYREKFNVAHSTGHIIEDYTFMKRKWEKSSNFATFQVRFLTSCFSFNSKEYLEIVFMSWFMKQFEVYFHSVFDQGIDRRYFYNNFRDKISKEILGDSFNKSINYLKHHFDNGYYHLHFESKNYYLPMPYFIDVLLALYKKQITRYFNKNDVDITASYRKFCHHGGVPSVAFEYYTAKESAKIMREIFNEIQPSH